MGPVALLVFKTSVPANTGLVSSTLTRLRHPSSIISYNTGTYPCSQRFSLVA